ncbi:MAG: hypothetical protein J0I98_18740 [Mesorhizobium sp.]|nr:hypothetical protein [Mesorhizobium sp.]MBN9244825.1 hypothetical protein [Mesorhizobium sp.]
MAAQREDKEPEDKKPENIEPEDRALEEKLAESLADLVPETRTVSEDEFAEVVGGALEAVGGRLLFKMHLDKDGESEHVAAASVGDGGDRQFLLLTLPASGGALKVEAASKSGNPVAKIAASYAGLMDVFQAAA